MKVVTIVLGVLGLVGGLYYMLSSLTAQVMTGEHAATLACACFLFVITLGIWQSDPPKSPKS